MQRRQDCLRTFRNTIVLVLALAAMPWLPANADGETSALPVIPPLISCEALASIDVSTAVGAAVRLKTGTISTAKGAFCQVQGTIAPQIGFEIDLPLTRWTQRYLQAGCGGLCGSINASIGNAGGCLPATEGEFVVGASDLGHQSAMMSPTEGDFGSNPAQVTDFAERANHLTAVAARQLIRAFYGQQARYAYFSGCSDGGREALIEAQRYPDDFDGISAGAPALLFTVQNSFWHAWTRAANLDDKGQPILYAERLPLLHAVILAHCDALDGSSDQLLSDPRSCQPRPDWLVCSAGQEDPAHCFSAAEWNVVAKLYAGPTDAAGHHFLPGGALPGSELQWDFLPRRVPPSGVPPGGFGGNMLSSMSKVVYPDPLPGDSNAAQFAFTQAQLKRVLARHDLLDATNPDLGPFAAHGGKLILWHGLADTSIAPMISVAYYQAVQQTVGKEAADRFTRLFLLPGVGHCGGGDGFAQFDSLSPLMRWVEQQHAPQVIVAGKIPERRMGPLPTAMANGPDGRGGFGAARAPSPFAAAASIPQATRPIYPFPDLAAYSGKGDMQDAASYVRTTSPSAQQALDWSGSFLLVPAQIHP